MKDWLDSEGVKLSGWLGLVSAILIGASKVMRWQAEADVIEFLGASLAATAGFIATYYGKRISASGTNSTSVVNQ